MDLLRARYVTYRFARHAHAEFAIGVVLSGVEEFHHRGELMRAGAGSVVMVNPGEVHTGQAGVPEGWAYRMLYPSVELVTEVAEGVSRVRGAPHFPTQVAYDATCVRLLRLSHRAAERGDGLASSTLVTEALAELLTRYGALLPSRTAHAAAPRAVRLAREILHAGLVDPPSLADLAEATGTRPFPLLRAFKATLGLPPHAYLNQVRVWRARELLAGGTAPVRVATEVGFSDQAHLTRHFKRLVGVTPGAYQRATSRPGASRT